MSKRLMPYSASAWISRKMWEVLKKVQSTHQGDGERAGHIADALEEAFLQGEAKSDGHAFRWGLAIGAVCGATGLGLLQWIAGRLLS